MQAEPYERVTQYHETDQMGIINHINYIKWLEEARVDFLEKIGYGYEKSVEHGIDFAVLGISCKYRKMTRFREKVKIYAMPKELKPMRAVLSYRIVGEDGSVRFTAESEHCYYSSRKQRPVALNRELPQLYDLLRSYMEEQG